MHNLKIISLGNTFSGGGIVLNEIIRKLESKPIQYHIHTPPLISNSNIITRLMQIIWIIFWPFAFTLSKKNKYLIAHSFFLLSPFIFLINKSDIIFLFQGEEYYALKGIKSKIIRFIFQIKIPKIKTIATNFYLKNVAANLKAEVLKINYSLGPKEIFLNFDNKNIIIKTKIVFFGRSGFNKAAVDSIKLALRLPDSIKCVFIVPDFGHALFFSKYSNIEVVVTTDPQIICETIVDSLAVFIPSYYEGLSLPLLESLALKTPVITFAKGYPYEISKILEYVIYISDRDISKAEYLIQTSIIKLKLKFLKDDVNHLKNYSFNLFCSESTEYIYNICNDIKS